MPPLKAQFQTSSSEAINTGSAFCTVFEDDMITSRVLKIFCVLETILECSKTVLLCINTGCVKAEIVYRGRDQRGAIIPPHPT